MATSNEEEQTDHFMKQSERLASSIDVSVPQFYSGRSIFITGGTGFMGKVSVCFENNLKISTICYDLMLESISVLN